jgi:hypothetical protein
MEQWMERLAALPPGGLALATFAATFAVAYLGYHRLRPLAWLIPVGALVSAVWLVIDLPKDLVRYGLAESAVPWARMIVAAAAAVLVGKLLLLHRHATAARWQSGSQEPPTLLPSQQRYLASLKELIADQSRRGVGRVLPLDGRPGEGKSFLLRQLKHDLDPGRKQVVVIVDVWQQQTEADLQAAILEAVFSHPAYLRRYRWLRVPVNFLFARQLALLHRFSSTLRLKLIGSDASIELDLKLPALRWQRQFEQATARMAGEARTVIVLDELDRAVPAVTQSALTLARRSVDVPGVTVILAYVREQVRYKAFNPLLPTVLPDLASSMEAVLYEHHHQLAPAGSTGANGSILRSWQELQESPVAKAAGFLAGNRKSNQNGHASRDPAAESPQQLWLRLGVFARADRLLREQLQERFEEKYLGAPALRLTGAAPDDVAHMVTDFDSARRLLSRLSDAGDGRDLATDRVKQVREAVEQGVDRWHQEINREGGRLTSAPIRVLEGYLHNVLEAAVAVQGRGGPALAPADIAALVVGAYYVAALIYGGGSNGQPA